MVLRAWDEYLFQAHSAVRLDPWSNNRIRLLDVLVKKERKDGKEMVGRVGSVLKAGHWSEEAEQSSRWNLLARESMQSKLRRFSEEEDEQEIDDDDDDDDFEKSPDVDIHVELKHSATVLASILGAGYARLKASFDVGQQGFAFNVRNVSYEKVADDFLIDVFREDPPLWTPDVHHFQRMGWKTSGGLLSGTTRRDLWIVTEIRYATKIIVSSCESLGVDGRLSFDIPAVPIEGVGFQLKIQKTTDESLEITAPTAGQRFPFAMKAFRLSYSKDGKKLLPLGGIDTSIGSRPIQVLRHGIDVPGPDKDPRYHMADLLEKQGDEDQRLPMQDDDDDMDQAQD